MAEPGLRAAVEAALGDLARAYVVDRSGATALGAERGHLVVRERLAGIERALGSAADLRRLDDALAAAGGGRLADALRRDPAGAVRPLLARVAWVPDLAAALELQAVLPAGWTLVTRDGGAVVDGASVRLGRGDSSLERRAELDRLERDLEGLEAEADSGRREARAAADAQATAARTALETARAAEAAAAAHRRRAEELERAAGREAEAAAREAAWHLAQAERLAAEVERATAGHGGPRDGGQRVHGGSSCRGRRGGGGGGLGGAGRRAAEPAGPARRRRSGRTNGHGARRSPAEPGPRRRSRWPRRG